ncbi:MAG: O-antigen ligase family protein [Flavobacteriaceae bacterium]|jgi:O-antigen ligase|nr:O-antigen ligase family protein [Flavobacteriaceae bacterium]
MWVFDARKLYLFLVVVFVFFLLFDFKVVNIVLPITFVSAFISYKEGITDFKNYISNNKVLLSILFSLVIYEIIIAILAKDLDDKRIGFYGLWIASFLVLFRLKNISCFFNVILGVVFILMLGGSYNIYQYYLSTDDYEMGVGSHINPMLIVARPYLGYILNIGIILSLYMYSSITEKIRYGYLILAICFFSYLVLIANRIQLVSLSVIFILYFSIYTKMRLSYRIGAFGLLCVLVISMIRINPTLASRFEIKTIKEQNDNFIDRLSFKEPRIVIWKCSAEIAEDSNFNPLIGVGNKKIIDSKLSDCYDKTTVNNPMRQYFLDEQFGTHNLFVEFYLLSGLIGILLLLSLFVYISFKVRKNFFAFSIAIALFNFCLVENLLDGQLGAYLLGFTLFVILKVYKFNFNKDEESDSYRLVR